MAQFLVDEVDEVDEVYEVDRLDLTPPPVYSVHFVHPSILV